MTDHELPLPVLSDDNDIVPADEKGEQYVDEKVDRTSSQPITEEERHAISARAEKQGIALATDFDHVVEEMMTLTDDQAVELLLEAMDIHDGDPNFPAATWARITALIQGYKACDMSEADWSFSVRAEAAIIFFHSPYPEVRAVTDPHDDDETPCETIRIYVIGTIFVLGSTALNSFFHPRQPAITLGPNVLQLLVLPCGMLCAKVLPDWGFNFRGKRWSLNPGKWSYKEQVLCNIFFDMTDGYNNVYDVLLVQKLPVYLKQSWVSYGYEILLSLSIQFIGFSYAGILRRFAVFPVTAMWPSVLPTLALSRTLTMPEKRERIHGWKIRRYQWFGLIGLCSFVWFWIPNFLFGALRAFNWMTWIAPNNFNLAAVTGFYGGMGFNPWASFDWNVWGKQSLVTPFFSTLQSTIGMALGGMIILAQSYTNHYWTGYMPPNSNTVYNREGTPYQVSKVLDNEGNLDVTKYYEYGPPFWASFNIFHNGQSYAWCTMVIVYISIRYWTQLSKAFRGIWRSLITTESVYKDFEHDAQIRIYRKYKEVPEWWFMVLLVLGLGMAFAAVEGWPTGTPWWALIFTLVFTAICIVPMTFIVAQANVSIESAAILQLLSSIIFPGKAQTLLIFAAFGTNNLDQSRTYAHDVKLGLYARIPPRTLFRAQLLSVLLQSFVFVSIINWLTASFDPETFCTAANASHFVCNSATQHFSVAVESGLMGAGVLFDLYPILPYCFLLGLILGLVWGFTEKFGPRVVAYSRRRHSERTHAVLRKYMFVPISYIGYIQPHVLWAGAHLWGGANNLSYYLQGLYASFIFMYYIKRRYPAWWEKYNYLLQQGLDVGVALSGLVMTLATKFGPKPVNPPNWWGNNVSTAGMDFKIYNSKAALKTVPKGGSFGPPADQFPKPGQH